MCPTVTYATLLLGLTSLIYCTRTDFKLIVKYKSDKGKLNSQSFTFSDEDLKAFRDCVCQQSWDDCSYNHIGNEGGWQWRGNKSTEVLRHTQFSHFECQLVQTDNIACYRREIMNTTVYQGFLHGNNDIRSETVCAVISWNSQQTAEISQSKNTIFSTGDEMTENKRTLSPNGAILPTVTKIDITNLTRTEFVIFQQTSKEYSTMTFDTVGTTSKNSKSTGKEFITNNTIIIMIVIIAIISIAFGITFMIVKLHVKQSPNATTVAIEGDLNYDYVTINSDTIQSTGLCPADANTGISQLTQPSETLHYSTVSRDIHSDVRHWESGHQRNRVSNNNSIKPSTVNEYAKLRDNTKAFQNLYNTESDIVSLLDDSGITPVVPSIKNV